MQFVQFVAARADTGAVLPYASVTVYQTGTSTLAPLFDQNGAPIGNPVIAQVTGTFGVAAPDGVYDIAISSSDGLYLLPMIEQLQFADLTGIIGTITSGRLGYGTWAELTTNTSAANAVLAEVPTSDTGTHTDPVVGGTVNNAGIFRKASAGWQRIYDNGLSPASGSDQLSGVSQSKALTPYSDASAPAATVSIIGTGTLAINLQAKTITSTGTLYLATRKGAMGIPASQSVTMTFSSATSLQTIYVNSSTGVLGSIENGNIPVGAGQKNVAIAFVFGQRIYPIAAFSALLNLSLVNSSGVTSTWLGDLAPAAKALLPLSRATILQNGALAINRQAGTVTTGAAVVAYATVDGIAGLTANQSVTLLASGNTLLVYAVGATLGVANNTAIPANAYLIAIVTPNGSCVADAPFGNVTYVSSTGISSVVNIGGSASTAKAFVPTATRLIVPDEMFFVDTLALPIYKSSIVIESDAALYGQTRVAVLSDVAGDRSPYKYFSEDRDLLGGSLNSSFRIGMRNWTYDGVLIAPVLRHLASSTALSGTSPKILVIGDSTSQFGGITALNNALIALGATPQFLGTFAAGQNPYPAHANLKGEARGSWSLRSFVGRDGIAATSNISIGTPSSGGTTTQFQHAMLRVATSADYSAHPERCFLWVSGQFRNVTYAEETAAGTTHSADGSYYIFDFAAFLASWGIATPDIVIIALDDNDVIWGGGAGGAGSHSYTQAEMISFAAASLDIMVHSIREASSAIKIGVSPLAARGNTAANVTNWVNLHGPLIEAQMTEIRTLRSALDTNIHGIGTWAHTNRDFPFPNTTSAAVSVTNDSQIQNVSDAVHYTTDSTQVAGKLMVANVWAAFVACMVAGV